MTNRPPIRFKTISEFHAFRNLPKPAHPLISVIDMQTVDRLPANEAGIIKDFYSIALKRNFAAKIKYGQQTFDFDEGVMFFMSPGQLLRLEVEQDTILRHTGWMLLIHPDFLWNTPLAKNIKNYEYFDYSVNEALFLSDKEEQLINGIIANIEQEYLSNIDKFSQDIIIAQLELLFSYSERFYQRQFITRKINNHQILARMEEVVSDYLAKEELISAGLPTVNFVARTLNVSSNYLGGLVKLLTGQTTQQYIHEQLINKAKQQLAATTLSVSEIAYGLGFEHPQSFSKLFKIKTRQSPSQFRESLQ